MKIRHLLISVMLISLPAAADFTTISRAYEVPLNLFQVPVTSNGVIQVKQCADCEVHSGRLTSSTIFRINGQVVELTEFRRQAFSVRDREAETVIVLHHLETDTIKSISLTL